MSAGLLGIVIVVSGKLDVAIMGVMASSFMIIVCKSTRGADRHLKARRKRQEKGSGPRQRGSDRSIPGRFTALVRCGVAAGILQHIAFRFCATSFLKKSQVGLQVPAFDKKVRLCLMHCNDWVDIT